MSGIVPDFRQIDTWVFDLDNTLYAPSTNLFGLIDDRMSLYIANRMGLDGISARALQKYYYSAYGTTMRGLMDIDAVDPIEFMDFVHDISHAGLAPDARMIEAINRLPGKRYILTNGSAKHAENVSKALGIDHLFNDVFDIIAADFTPKPHQKTYETFLSRFGVDPKRAVMFEDLAGNLLAPHTLGMATVLVNPLEGTDIVGRHAHIHDSIKGAHVDYVTDNLAEFLHAAHIPDRLL